MKRPDILRRLSSIGFTVPVIGGGMTATLAPPSEAEAHRADRILTFLEDRRVLFDPMDREVTEYAIRSVVEMRRFLSDELMRLDRTSVLAANVRGMLGACRQFLTRTQEWDVDGHRSSRMRLWPEDQVFHQALGELRGHFSVHVAQMAAAHGHDVDGHLAAILPETDDVSRS